MWCVCSKTVSIDGFEDVPKSDEHALRQAVSQQPISVAICASELQFYGSGEPPAAAVSRGERPCLPVHIPVHHVHHWFLP